MSNMRTGCWSGGGGRRIGRERDSPAAEFDSMRAACRYVLLPGPGMCGGRIPGQRLLDPRKWIPRGWTRGGLRFEHDRPWTASAATSASAVAKMRLRTKRPSGMEGRSVSGLAGWIAARSSVARGCTGASRRVSTAVLRRSFEAWSIFFQKPQNSRWRRSKKPAR